MATIFIIVVSAVILNNSSTLNSTSNEPEKSSTVENSDTSLSVSGYTSNIEVDCFRKESAYVLLINNATHTVYYANSDRRHFIFANFSSSLEGKTIRIYNPDFSYDISASVKRTAFLSSKHVNSTLEFSLEQILVENDFYLSVNALVIRLRVVPVEMTSPTFTLPPAEEVTKTETKTVRVSWIQDLNDAFKKNPVLGVLFGLVVGMGSVGFVFGCVHYNSIIRDRPPMHVRGRKNEVIDLGRFIREDDDELLPGYRKFWFKKDEEHAGLREVHCKEAYSIVKSSTRRRVNFFQEDFFDYHHINYKLPERLQYKKHLPVASHLNGFYAFFIRHFPNASLAKHLNKKIRMSEEEFLITEVEVLENRNAVKRVTPVVDVSYIQKIADEKKGEIDAIIEGKTMPYYEYFRLQQDKSVRKITIKNPRMELLDIRNLEYAEEYQDSIESVRATHYIELMEFKREYDKTIEQLTNFISTLNYNNLAHARDEATQFLEINKILIPNVKSLMTDFIGYSESGANVDEAKQLAYNKAFSSKMFKEQERTISDNPSMKDLIESKAKNELLEKLLKEKQAEGNDSISKTLNQLEIFETEGGNNKKKKIQVKDDFES